MEPRIPDDRTPESYEPPCVEQVMSAEDLAREVHYAGAPVSG
jgi:hypothetical protein